MMKIRDIQFARYFLTSEVEVDPEILDTPIQIKFDGEPDIIYSQKDRLLYQNPSSVTMFIFHVLYEVLSKYSVDPYSKDRLGLGLLYMCRNYVYLDQNTREIDGPPVIVDFDKIPVPSIIIRDLIEPIIGEMSIPRVLFMPCNFTDACRIVESSDQLNTEYGLPGVIGGVRNFPVILCNSNIHNSASQLSHLILKVLENALKWEKTEKVIRNLLLGNEGSLTNNLILILKTMKGDPKFVIDFLKLLESSINWTYDEIGIISEHQEKAIMGDSYLGEHIKIAGSSSTSQVFKQWSQWSVLMGLIEKQLEPMRGSMWPATENIKPHEDRFRLRLKEKTEEKNKNQINFEEMLETARDLYNHNAVEPGQLIEVMLKGNRVWK